MATLYSGFVASARRAAVGGFWSVFVGSGVKVEEVFVVVSGPLLLFVLVVDGEFSWTDSDLDSFLVGEETEELKLVEVDDGEVELLDAGTELLVGTETAGVLSVTELLEASVGSLDEEGVVPEDDPWFGSASLGTFSGTEGVTELGDVSFWELTKLLLVPRKKKTIINKK